MVTSVDAARVSENVARIREQIAATTDRAVSIVAVTKSFGVDAMYAAQEAGCEAVGENYAQELLSKISLAASDSRGPLRLPVHFIGRIQTNKVRQLEPHVDVWQSVDRTSVVQEIARRANSVARVMIQVNSTGEVSKGGCPPDRVGDLVADARAAGLDVRGLMTIGPTGGASNEIERAFRLVRTLADSLDLEECSMGMSDDYLIAAACGSTIVRLGSVLFGARLTPA